jgi:hypothetical protein
MTSASPLGLAQLPDAARRLLAQEQDRSQGGADKALRFGGTWSKLEKGVSFQRETAMLTG